MTINYLIQTFDNQEPPHLQKTIKIRNALSLPLIDHILNIDFEDYVVKEVRHRVAYKEHSMTDEKGILSTYQQVDGIVVIAVKKEDSASYTLK